MKENKLKGKVSVLIIWNSRHKLSTIIGHLRTAGQPNLMVRIRCRLLNALAYVIEAKFYFTEYEKFMSTPDRLQEG